MGSATVCDALGGEGVVGEGLLRIAGRGGVCGRAVTAYLAAGSGGVLTDAVAAIRPGDVLCVSAPARRACLGDLLATELRRVGAVAAVVDGLVRDRARLEEIGLSVFARGVTPCAGHVDGRAQAQVPIAVGETTVRPGDWIVADDDGAVAVPSGVAAELVRRADALVARDGRLLEAMRSGVSLFEAWPAERAGT